MLNYSLKTNLSLVIITLFLFGCGSSSDKAEFRNVDIDSVKKIIELENKFFAESPDILESSEANKQNTVVHQFYHKKGLLLDLPNIIIPKVFNSVHPIVDQLGYGVYRKSKFKLSNGNILFEFHFINKENPWPQSGVLLIYEICICVYMLICIGILLGLGLYQGPVGSRILPQGRVQ